MPDSSDLPSIVILTQKFQLGRLCATPGALAQIDHAEIAVAVTRHAQGDWGDDLDDHDWSANESALRDGSRLVSFFNTGSGERFLIITEWDRSVTTILLPEEY